MKKIFLPLFLFLAFMANSQQFVTSGSIEFEVKINNHKLFGNDIFAEMLKDKMPQFSITYYQYLFDGEKSLYKFDRFDERTRLRLWMNENLDENIWYNDYSNNTFTNQKFVFDNTYNLSGSLMNIDWKLSPNETREIAGFNCRKATGIIFDSVYVFAFYTEEITSAGGPMGIHGLPGMILGITIPRMFSSWIATKLQVNTPDIKKIMAPTKGKKKEATELKESILKVSKDWGSWGQQAIYNVFL